jgi:hypothetical protein
MLGSVVEGWSQDHTDPQSVSKTIRFYPNPTNQDADYINVNVASLNSQKVKLALHNIIGNEIQVETEAVNDHELRIKIKGLSAGYYLVTVKDEDSQFRGIYKILIR